MCGCVCLRAHANRHVQYVNVCTCDRCAIEHACVHTECMYVGLCECVEL